MVNEERFRRGFAEDAVCEICEMDTESILHALRDCSSILGLWSRLIPDGIREHFFSTSLLQWIYSNLDPTGRGNQAEWATTFALGVWWCWKWRCGRIFGDGAGVKDRVRFIKELASNTINAQTLNKSAMNKVHRVETLVSWTKPSPPWVTLNTDGASRGNPGNAAAGGAVRNSQGEWLGGFAVNIGICSVSVAELWGVYYGLRMAWVMGFRKVRVEIDSQVVVTMLRHGVSEVHPLAFLVQMCHGFRDRDWLVSFTHVYREANRLADGLANLAFSLPAGYHFYNVVPDAVSDVLLDDAMGLALPRGIVDL